MDRTGGKTIGERHPAVGQPRMDDGMDAHAVKTFLKYAGIWIVAAVCFGAAVLGIAMKEERERWTEMAEVYARHPESEADLVEIYMKERVPDEEKFDRMAAILEGQYGYDFYECVFHSRIWYLFPLFLILDTGVLVFLFCLERKKTARNHDVIVLELNEILEQLEAFQNGGFQVSDRKLSAGMAAEDSFQNTIDAIWDMLQKIGTYFGVLKEQMKTEENSTKALITDISHQFRTPISALRISYELIAEENLTEQERGEFLDQAGQEVHRLEVLLEELVNLSRLECSMIQIKPEPADIGQTLREAVNQVYMKAHEKRIKIQLLKDQSLTEPVLIRHDRKWTIEALVNVLDNAVKYSEGDTCITIRMIRLPQNLLVEVEDEGIGIPGKELHRIYQRFYRCEEARKLVKEGVGVGLYLTRSILERQGGTITAGKGRERGTVFRITLPI